MSVLGRNAFRMELHAVRGQRRVHKSHHQPVIGFGVHFQCGSHACPFTHERMIACGFYWAVDVTEHSRAGMPDLRYLSVNRSCPHHFAAEGLPDGLMAKTNTEDRSASCRFTDQL